MCVNHHVSGYRQNRIDEVRHIDKNFVSMPIFNYDSSIQTAFYVKNKDDFPYAEKSNSFA